MQTYFISFKLLISSFFSYNCNKPHTPKSYNKPQIKEYYDNGQPKELIWLNNHNKTHRLNDPAIISFYENGTIQRLEWRINGTPHRIDGPAYIEYYPNKNTQIEIWYKNGKRHNENEPAYKQYDYDGTNSLFMWYENGDYYRENELPVIEVYGKNNKIRQKRWEGRLATYHDNGKIENIDISRNSTYDIERNTERFYENGKLDYISHIDNEEKIKFSFYYKNGKLKSIIYYDDKREEYHKNGQLKI